MSIGGSLPKQHHIEPMRMPPINREQRWYSVQVVSLRVGDIVVASTEEGNSKVINTINGCKGCIFDSGMTDTYLPSSISKAFGAAVWEWTNGLTDFSNKSRKKLYIFTRKWNRTHCLPPVPIRCVTFVRTVHPSFVL